MSELRRVELVLAEHLTPAQQAEVGKAKGLVAIQTRCSKPNTELKAINSYTEYVRNLIKK